MKKGKIVMSKEDKVYKIRNKSTGMYWSAGHWTKKGKIWQFLNHARCAFTRMQGYYYGNDGENAEIVEGTIIWKEVTND